MEFLIQLSIHKSAIDYAKKGNYPKIFELLSKEPSGQGQNVLKIIKEKKSETERLKDENKSLLLRIKQLEEENSKLKKELRESIKEIGKQINIISELKAKLTT